MEQDLKNELRGEQESQEYWCSKKCEVKQISKNFG